MTKKILILITFLSFSKSFAQEIFIQTGKNSTSYNFKASNTQSNVDYRSASGDFYEIGYNYNFKDSKIAYQVSFTYNQFNSEASSGATSYSWNTSYLGIQNMISYSFFKSKKGLDFSLKAGINTASIIKGDQFINNEYFDIKNQEEFAGIVLQPIIGINAKYRISEKIALSVGYNFSQALNLSNSSDEKLSFNTNQIQIGLHFPI
jgi:hypothetical protein